MIDELEVETVDLGDGFIIYQVGGWSFDEEDKNLHYIDGAIRAWQAWRAHVVAEIEAIVVD